LTATRARSSLRRSWPRTGVLPTLCVLLACAPAAAAAPAPDPSPAPVRPDPAPEATTPSPPVQASAPPRAPVVSRAAPVVAAATPKAQPPSRPRPRPAAKPKPRRLAPALVPRDSAPMPRSPFTPAAELLEPGRLLLAGVALAIVALGGAVVLGAGHRALTGARA
jgi:hypothetical protein